jgi:hypothetical protein
MKLEEVLMSSGMYKKMKDVFLGMVLNKNKIPNFKEVLNKLKEEYPSIKTNLETDLKGYRDFKRENRKSKLKQYEDLYKKLVKDYKERTLY